MTVKTSPLFSFNKGFVLPSSAFFGEDGDDPKGGVVPLNGGAINAKVHGTLEVLGDDFVLLLSASTLHSVTRHLVQTIGPFVTIRSVLSWLLDVWGSMEGSEDLSLDDTWVAFQRSGIRGLL